jgi:hypothetical protein
MGNLTWSACFVDACDTTRQTYHTGWAFTTRYTRHVSSLLQEVTTVSAHQHMHLEDYNHQLEAKDCLITGLRKSNKELHNDLLCTYRNFNFKTDALDSTRTQLQHA